MKRLAQRGRHRAIAGVALAVLGAVLLAAPRAPAQDSRGFVAAGSNSSVLNSERIEAAFGSYGIEVLGSSSRLRISNLYSTDEGVNTTRTIAIVLYPDVVDESLAAEHARILAGGSIGATFREAGWDVLKTHLYIGETEDSPWLRELMRRTEEVPLAIHVYSLGVGRGGRRQSYATIAEIHHPAYLRYKDLLAIYAPNAAPVPDAGGRVAEVLELARSRTR